VLLIMAVTYVSHFIPDKWQQYIITTMSRGNVVIDALLLTVVIYLVLQVKSSAIQPFIYFQF